MPHFGHFPAFSDTTSGCIGHEYCAFAAASPTRTLTAVRTSAASQNSTTTRSPTCRSDAAVGLSPLR